MTYGQYFARLACFLIRLTFTDIPLPNQIRLAAQNLREDVIEEVEDITPSLSDLLYEVVFQVLDESQGKREESLLYQFLIMSMERYFLRIRLKEGLIRSWMLPKSPSQSLV